MYVCVCVDTRSMVQRFIDAAAQLSGVRSELTGALGRRTRWQKSAKSQLIVAAGSAGWHAQRCVLLVVLTSCAAPAQMISLQIASQLMSTSERKVWE